MGQILVQGRSCCESCEDEFGSVLVVTNQVLEGNGPPTFTPAVTSIAYIYKDLVDGGMYVWNTTTQTWV